MVQVAAHADHHIVVRKAVDSQGRTITKFSVLDEQEERVKELAAMLGLGTGEALQMLQNVHVP